MILPTRRRIPLKSGDKAAIPVTAQISSMIRGQSSSGRLWPIPGYVTNRAPGMRAAVSRPPLGLISGSSRPEMTSVGAVICEIGRIFCARPAASWR